MRFERRLWVIGCLTQVIATVLLPGSAAGQRATPVRPSSESVTMVDESLERAPLIIFLGDSLTAGLGVREEQAYPSLVAERLRAVGLPVRVVNAGISGDTTAGGVSRLDWLLAQEPDVMVVGLGANDGLRGLSLAETESNLDRILQRSLARGVEVLLVGMKIPPSYGPDYAGAFAAMFERLAANHEVALLPFLLAGVAADPDLNQADGIHPNAEGHRRLAANVQPYLEALLRQP